MSPVFSINFRREVWEREQARARRRVVALGVWVAYFGVMAMLLGLYGLNAVSFSRRVASLERQAARAAAHRGERLDWTLKPAELAQLDDYVENPARWHRRLSRLSSILPPNVTLTSIDLNPQNLTGGGSPPLVISGRLRTTDQQERMRGVMNLVSTLHSDSVFGAGYQNIKLASTSIPEGPGSSAEFVIECR